MMEFKFSFKAWEQYVAWQGQDKRTLKRINELLKDIACGNPYEGIGKPEPLKGDLSGLWTAALMSIIGLSIALSVMSARLPSVRGITARFEAADRAE